MIRMTLRGREVKPLEHACAEIVARGKQQGFKVSGPKRIPTKVLTVTTRRSPCGNGTNTYDHFEMRIHKRVIDVWCPPSIHEIVPLAGPPLSGSVCSTNVYYPTVFHSLTVTKAWRLEGSIITIILCERLSQ